MKRITRLKTLILLLFVATAMTMSAQSGRNDEFFKNDNDDIYNNRLDNIVFTGLGNDPFGEAPIGNGILLFVAAGAGYAVMRRKRNTKKGATLLLALAILLGMTQCKKKIDNTVIDNGNKVRITLTVGNGSRHEITPNENGYVPVRFLEGDVIYVGDGSQYIGTLTCTVDSDEHGNNASFSGDITQPAIDDVLHFYFVGGLTPQNFGSGSAALAAGETSFIVDITDQKDKLPVLSYTTVVYSGNNNLSCTLKNKCALVEFKFAVGTNKKVKVSNMLCEAKIDFAHPGINPTEKLDAITLYPDNNDNTKKWAILLLSDTQRKSTGMVYNKTETYNSTKVDIYDYYDGVVVPALTESNNYLYGTSAINVNNSAANINNKVFAVSANGNAVRFAPGNLKCTKTPGTTWANGYEWSFMEHQYDIIETASNNYCTDDYGDKDVVSLFGWGCTGMHDALYYANQERYFPYNTTVPNWYTDCYGPTGYHDLSVQNKSDWGAVVPNTEGYNWRCLTKDEWNYLLNGRYDHNSKSVGAKLNDISLNGAILIPEGVSGSVVESGTTHTNYNNNKFSTTADLETFLNNYNAVFLPTSGYRNANNVSGINNSGYYWTSTNNNIDVSQAYQMRISNASFGTTIYYRAQGCAVRLVR